MPGDLAGHRFTRPECLMQCETMLVIATWQGTYARRPNRGRIPSKQSPQPSKYLISQVPSLWTNKIWIEYIWMQENGFQSTNGYITSMGKFSTPQLSLKKGKNKTNRCFKKPLCIVRMQLLKHILLVVNNLTKITSPNYLIEHLSLEVISWWGPDFSSWGSWSLVSA